MGRGPQAGGPLQRQGFARKARKRSPCRRAPAPAAEGDLAAALQRRRARRRPPSLLSLPPHAAGGRGRPPLRRAARVRAVPAAAPRGAGRSELMHSPEHERAVKLRPARLRREYSPAPWTPSPRQSRSTARARRSSTTSPTSRTTRSSATTTSRTGGCLRIDSVGPRGRRALPHRRAVPALRLGRHDLRRGRAAVPDRRRRAAAGSTTASRPSPPGRSAPRRAAAPRRWSSRPRPSRRCSPTAWSRRFGHARLVQARQPQGAAPAAGHPRGGPRPRRPRHGRRAVGAQTAAPPIAVRRPPARSSRSPPCSPPRCAPAGCGNREEVRTLGETEGIYLDIDELKYQVQISRYLNPNDVEDRDYLLGLPGGAAEQPAATRPGSASSCACRTRPTSRSRPPTRSRSSTRRRTSTARSRSTRRPTRSPTWRETVPPGGLIPHPDSAAGTGPVQGSLLLFKLKTDSLQNRPLEFRISRGGTGTVGIVDLDV